MKNTRFAKLGAVCAGAIVLALVGSSAASAEPTSGAYRSYAAVGSDTIQDVWNALSNSAKAPAGTVASYDAFGQASTTIKTKSSGKPFKRPQGSGAGVLALSASKHAPYTYDNGAGGTVNIQRQVDFARSSSGPSSAFPGTALTYIPFARDAVSVVSNGLSGSGITNFTTAQLTAIYSCSTSADGVITTAAGADPVYHLASGATRQLSPLIPQTGSGTRSFFLSAIGVAAPAACVDGQTGTPIAENNGTVLNQSGELIPFSVAQWIAQKNGVASNTVSNSALAVANLNSKTATTGTIPKLRPGTLFGTASVVPTPGVGVFNRDTYSVVTTTTIIGSTATGLEKVLTRNLTTATARGIIANYGFLNLSYLGNRANYKQGGFTN